MQHDVAVAMAGLIRQVDGDNRLSPTDLGEAIVAKMPPHFQTTHGKALVSLVAEQNPDKRLSAGRLAELIVADFDLSKEG